MSKIINFFKDIPQFVWDVLGYMFGGLIKTISFVFYVIYDGFLIVTYAFIDAMDFSAVMFNTAAQYSNMPPQLIWLINQVALPQALTYIAAALVIRVSLNLIPGVFTRV